MELDIKFHTNCRGENWSLSLYTIRMDCIQLCSEVVVDIYTYTGSRTGAHNMFTPNGGLYEAYKFMNSIAI